MRTPGERLKEAREKFYTSARGAGEDMGFPEGTYPSYENGNRGFDADLADKFAKKFKVNTEWLQFERGPRDRKYSIDDQDLTAEETERVKTFIENLKLSRKRLTPAETDEIKD